MNVRVTASMVALLLAGCQAAGSGADGACPALPAVRAVASFEHRGNAPDARQADTLPDSWPEYLLHADSGYAMPQAGLAHLCGVHLVVRDSLGRTVAEVIAATGELDREREIVVVRGDVIVDLPLQGRRIETEELHYAPHDNRVWSTTTTTFREGDASLTGSSFTADRYFETVHLEQARGGIRLP
jgi:LPS export ABC transporter protein LptC